MANLAIKGHPTRGDEVIEILEMLGGENKYKLNGCNIECAYYKKNGVIYNTSSVVFNNIKLLTLEEFLEKFPYKVGDKILYKTYGIYAKIKTMLWNEEKEQVFYRLESNKLFVAAADELQPRKEELIKKCNMILKIELEIEVTGDCSFEEAEDFFLYAFAGYSLPDWKNNPLINEDSDTEYDVTNIKIEEV